MDVFESVESPGEARGEWQVKVEAESLKIDQTITYDDDHVDWDQSIVTISLRGSVQSVYDLSDALEAASTSYTVLAHRDRRSNPRLAQGYAEIAPRMSALAKAIEVALGQAIDVTEDGIDRVTRGMSDREGQGL